MFDFLVLGIGVASYIALWSGTLGAFRPLSMERSGIYILVTGLGAGLVLGADRFIDHGVALNALAKMLAESAYLALVVFLRSVRLELSRRQEIKAAWIVLIATMLHLTLNLTLPDHILYWVMAVQIVLLFSLVLRESLLLWRAQPSGMTLMLLVLVTLHLVLETAARGVIGYHMVAQSDGGGAHWRSNLDGWLWVTFSVGYVVLTATASVLMDSFRADKIRLEQAMRRIESRLHEKESALISLLIASADHAKEPVIASLAHELKQPLHSIQLSAEYLNSGKSRNRSEESEILQSIIRENRRAADLVQNMRNIFINKVPEQQGYGSLSSWLVEWLNARAPSLLQESGVTLQVHAQAGLTATIPATQLEIILRNLLTNAVEALSDRAGGTIHVSLSSYENRAGIDFMDNGPGVPDSIAGLVFDMGFTTKEDGMGLGLWLSRRIAEMHGGELVCVPCDDGAHMRVILPLRVG